MKKAGVDLVGVSNDKQKKSDAFARSLDLPYPLVGDRGGSIISDYGVGIPLLGLARRVTFYIGRDKKIRAVHSGNDIAGHIGTVVAGTEARSTGG